MKISEQLNQASGKRKATLAKTLERLDKLSEKGIDIEVKGRSTALVDKTLNKQLT